MREFPTNTKYFSLLAFGLLVLLVLVSYSIWQDYRSSISISKDQVESQTRVLSEHAAQSFNAVSIMMDAAIARVEVAPNGNPELTPGNVKYFEALTDAVPQVRHLVAIRRDGTDSFSNIGKSRGVQLADRTYFKVQKKVASLHIFIDEPVVGRATGRNFIPISHRISGPNNRFDGILMGVLDQKYFSDFYRTTEKGKNISSALISSSGKLFAWSGNFFRKEVSQKIPTIQNAKLFKELINGKLKGTIIGPMLDPDRVDIISYSKIAKTPYSIVSRVNRKTALSSWIQKSLFLVGFGLLSMAGLFWYASSSVKQARIREQAKKVLLAAYENLELKVDERTAEIKESEAKLIRAEERLTDAINSLPLNFSLYDADERLILTNRDNVPWIDQPATDIIGKRAEDILRSYIKMGRFPAASGREEEYVAERMAQFRKHDSPAIIEFSDGRLVELNYCKTSDGGTVGIRTDITERKLAEQKLKESEENYRSVINQMQDGLILVMKMKFPSSIRLWRT